MRLFWMRSSGPQPGHSVGLRIAPLAASKQQVAGLHKGSLPVMARPSKMADDNASSRLRRKRWFVVVESVPEATPELRSQGAACVFKNWAKTRSSRARSGGRYSGLHCFRRVRTTDEVKKLRATPQ